MGTPRSGYSQGDADSLATEVRKPPVPPAPLLPGHGPKPTPNPGIQPVQHRRSFAGPKGSQPRYNLVEKTIDNLTNLEAVDYVVTSSYNSLPHEWYRIVRLTDPEIQRMVSSRQTATRSLDQRFTKLVVLGPHPDLRFDCFGKPDFRYLWTAPVNS